MKFTKILQDVSICYVLLVKQLCEELYHHILLMYMIKIVIVLYSWRCRFALSSSTTLSALATFASFDASIDFCCDCCCNCNYVDDTTTPEAFFTLRLCKFCLSIPSKIVEPSNSLVFDSWNVCFLALNSCFQGVPIITWYASNHHSTMSLYTFSTIIVIFLISYHSHWVILPWWNHEIIWFKNCMQNKWKMHFTMQSTIVLQ